MEMWLHLLEKGWFCIYSRASCVLSGSSGTETKENVARLVHLDEQYLLLKEYVGKSYLHISAIMKFYLTFDVYYNSVRL